VLRRVKGLTARRVIDYLKEHDYQSSLAKLRHEEWKRKHSYSLWQQEKNVFSIFSEAVFMQKVNYIHLNPVRLDWSSEQSTIAGRAPEFGKDANRMMNLCRLIVIGSNGGGHSPLGSWEVLSEGRRPVLSKIIAKPHLDRFDYQAFGRYCFQRKAEPLR